MNISFHISCAYIPYQVQVGHTLRMKAREIFTSMFNDTLSQRFVKGLRVLRSRGSDSIVDRRCAAIMLLLPVHRTVPAHLSFRGAHSFVSMSNRAHESP